MSIPEIYFTHGLGKIEMVSSYGHLEFYVYIHVCFVRRRWRFSYF